MRNVFKIKRLGSIPQTLEVLAMVKYILGLLLVVSMTSCCFMFFKGYNCISDERKLKGWGKYQDIESKLRIDGEYFSKYWSINHKVNSISRVTFYNNGIFSGFIGGQEDSGKDSAHYKEYLEYCQNRPDAVGSYIIKNDSIFLYKLVAIDGAFHVLEYGGIIGSDKKSLNINYENFLFDSTAHKPDSVTDLFKNKYLQEELKKGYEEYLQRGKK